jgi:ubiquinone/menaquinone biosynthesis C-methylase UbiE
MSSFTDPKALASQYSDDEQLKRRKALFPHYTPRQSPSDDVAALAVKFLSVTSRILDVGCGNGDFFQALCRLGFHGLMEGIDMSPGMIAEANRGVRAITTHFGIADVCDLPFGDSSFEMVVAKHMLYHVGDKLLAVSEIHRVLVDGGHFIAVLQTKRNVPKRHQFLQYARERFFPNTVITTGAGAFPAEFLEPYLNDFSAHDLIVRESFLTITDPAPYLDMFDSFRTLSFDPVPTDSQWGEFMAYIEGKVKEEISEKGYFTERSSLGIVLARK